MPTESKSIDSHSNVLVQYGVMLNSACCYKLTISVRIHDYESSVDILLLSVPACPFDSVGMSAQALSRLEQMDLVASVSKCI